MSCNCNSKYDNKVPCCCSQGTPLVCSTTTCVDYQICDQTIESDCVIYTGPNIQCSGVTSGMTVTEVMDIILEQLNLINCSYCWNVTNNTANELDFDYIDADGNTVTYPAIDPGTTVQVCGRSITSTTVTTVNLGTCATCSPTPTTTAPPLVATRCMLGNGNGLTGYYQMERTWSYPTYTFTLDSLLLDGVEYANGETLVITGVGDLVTGVSPIDGLTYVMNINDWLNSISGVAASGFVFYDDMHAVDSPDVSSTFYVQITMSNPDVTDVYYYDSSVGFTCESNGSILSLYTCEPPSTITTTATPTTTAAPTTTYIPSGLFRVENLNEFGTIAILSLGYSPTGFPNGYAATSGSIPLAFNGIILGTHARLTSGLNCSIISNRTGIVPGTEGRIEIYINGVLVLDTTMTTYAGQEGVYFNFPGIAEQTDNVEIIYS